MKKYRFISLLLCLMLCVSMIGVSASAESDKPYAGTTITLLNSYDYIDESVYDMFTEETGINIQFVYFDSMEDGYQKFEVDPSMWDVVIFSDYIIERLIANGMIAELDKTAMPNTDGVIEWMKTPDYDPTGSYSVPYMWGTLGILYNTNIITDEITSWKQLFDPKYQDTVFMQKSIRDTIGLTLKMLGYSMNETSTEALDQVKEALVQQQDDGIVAGYLFDEIKDYMISEEAGMAVMYAGDAAYAIYGAKEAYGEDGNYLKYVVPEEGSNVWIDAMAVSAESTNKEAAQVFIDFMCRPDIAFMNQQYIYYCSPITGAVDMMTDEEKSMEVLNPSEDTISRCEFYHDLSAEELELYEDYWSDIRAGF